MNDISVKIGLWYDDHKRDLPWRHTQNPYLIWLSEIILQQTRVIQGLDYYQRFVKRFPTVKELAEAQQDEVLKLWQGLGYYSRARNLHTAAIQVYNNEIKNSHASSQISFPSKYKDLIKLKGVGPYTAAAIASFSSDEQVAVVDGNVYRVLSRLFDIDTPIDSTKGQKDFLQLATLLLPKTGAGRHNQAIMELGALCCTPTAPLCQKCPVADHCMALANGTISQRPVKAGKIKIKERHLIYYIYLYEDSLWVHQRGEGDIWQGLWEFVLKEVTEENTLHQDKSDLQFSIKHQLTHQTLFADFVVKRIQDKNEAVALNNELQPMGYKRMTWIEWQQLAVPRLIDEANKRIAEAWL